MKNKIWILITLIVIYLLLKHIIPYWDKIIYPITLLVTFLHEFWHAFFAFITWWKVIGIQINSNGSWYTITSGWIKSLVEMWWYIWSAIFGNILLYIWFKKEKLSQNIIFFLSALIVFVAIFLYNSIFSSLILITLAIWLFFISKKTSYDSLILQFLWVSTIIYIIEDFNVWPSSDLANFSWILPVSVWMIVWLLIVLAITGYNLKLIFKK